MTPQVSVIVPVHNGERYLAETLDSVLSQSDPGQVEVIVVDNGSTDGTAAILDRYGDRLRRHRQPNSGGPAGPRNKGLEMAHAPLIIYMDADDLWPDDRLSVALSHMEDPEVDIALGHTRRFERDHFLEPELSMKLTASIIRRPVFDRIGGFDTDLKLCDDWDWFMRAREADLNITLYDEVSILYRRHEDNLSNNEAAANREFMRVLKRSLDRRRASGNMAITSMPKLSDFKSLY